MWQTPPLPIEAEGRGRHRALVSAWVNSGNSMYYFVSRSSCNLSWSRLVVAMLLLVVTREREWRAAPFSLPLYSVYLLLCCCAWYYRSTCCCVSITCSTAVPHAGKRFHTCTKGRYTCSENNCGTITSLSYSFTPLCCTPADQQYFCCVLSLFLLCTSTLYVPVHTPVGRGVLETRY